MPDDPGVPKIGLTLSARAKEEDRRAYRRALEGQGAEVVEIRAGEAIADASGLDGLLLGGGGDVDPARYGAENRGSKDIDGARDELEIALVEAAVGAGMPVLGICRGAQVLGVALGGTLVQDIATEVEGAGPHSEARHEVEVAEGSRLAKALGGRRVEVNSYHHQANKGLGSRVAATARAADGVIEGIEQGEGFVLGVQWHPERMLEEEGQRRLFAAFVSAAEERGRGKRPR